MRFAVNNNVGYFIQSSRKIYKKINEILNDETFSAVMQKKFDAIRIDTDASKVAAKFLSPVRNV